MFGLGWSEMVIIGVVALIVIGPKDLPNLFRTLGQFTGKARRMAREFSQAMEAAADEAGVKDMQKTLNAAANPLKHGVNTLRDSASDAMRPGSETAKLSEERKAQKEKMDARAAELVAERKAREAAAAETEADLASEATAEPDTAAPTGGRE